jgi:glycerol-3-phosphate cytidylyltransferase
MEAWEELKFNVIFHGDDWKGSPLYNKYKNEFAKVGVELVFLPHTKGTSSTEISKRLS